MSKGRAAKQKGSRAERQVRDELKKIYPVDRRSRINRVPMSGAGWMKGDVIDMNDTDMSYEVKNQETLALPEWWRQTKVQAQSWQTPVLIFTSNHRPLYWAMRVEDWESFAGDTIYGKAVAPVEASNRGIYAKLSVLDPWEYLVIELDGDKVAITTTQDYITVKKDIFNESIRDSKQRVAD